MLCASSRRRRAASARWSTAPPRPRSRGRPRRTAGSVVQIAAHLADSEIVGAWRFRTVLAQDGVPLQAYDQNAWASAFGYEQAAVAESVTLFGALRRATVDLLRRVDPRRHEHAGMHAERGRESIQHLMRMYAGHDLNHLAQIERLLGEARAARI
jgi:uncharacterized damage-inducible protein DinB